MAGPISVIGLGKLGLPLALLLADRGFTVHGFDADPALRAELKQGRTRLFEPGVQDLLRACAQRLVIAESLHEAASASVASFVIVPTPSGPDGRFSSDSVHSAVKGIAEAAAADHLVAIVSTVMPGEMEHLASAAGSRVRLCYCPEFVALGCVLDNMRRPDLVLIGEPDQQTGDDLVAILAPTWDAPPAVSRMNFINAELAKLTVNAMITAKISAANQISEFCDRLPGADAVTVLKAVGQDSRIGPDCLRPATAYGGPCFPRDNAALMALGAAIGLTPDLAAASQAINLRQSARVADRLAKICPQGTIAILGLTYKPGTDVCEASPGLAIADELVARGYRVRAYDPAVTAASIELAGSAPDCLAGADAAVVATPWPVFADLPAHLFDHVAVIDCWGILPDMPTLYRLGTGPETP